MSEPTTQTASPFSEHVLAAIVFSDVVEYSARMAKDADGTLAAVEADFKRLRQLCARYGGKVHNTMGDGMLMCFTSATHAVICALRAQQEFAERSRTNPDALRHRIGIHMGDITFGREGVSGDGVNVAARILTLAAPGGACLSEAVHRAVKSHLRLKVESMGTPALKNIAEPVPVCRVDIQGSRLPMRARIAAGGRRPLWYAIAATSAALLIAAGGWRWARRPANPAATPVAVTPPVPPAPGVRSIRSIAVMSFADLSPARDQEYFSDGIAEELTNTLARLPDIRVVGRTSAFAFKGRPIAAREIGRELNAGALVEGSVRKVGSRVRIAVQLTNTNDGFQLWSETFERDTADVFALQVEIARNIAQKLDVALGGGAKANLERLATDNLTAHTLYLRARHLLNRSGESTPEALTLFERAIAADPYYALAYAGAADCHLLLALQGRQPPAQFLPAALAAAERAKELDTILPDAHATVGFVRFYHEWNAAAAEEMFQRALALNPDHVGTLVWRAGTLLDRGQIDAGLADARRATELDPRSATANLGRASALLWARRPAEARAFADKARELNPDSTHVYSLLGQIADAAGDHAAAVQHYEAGRQRSPGNGSLLAGLARVHAVAGRKSEARALVRELQDRQKTGYVRAYLMAMALTGLDDTNATLNALEKAVAERDLALPHLPNTAAFDGLRDDPRFQTLAQQIGTIRTTSAAARR